ncbi:MAG: peptidoglycan-N-acetylglucosamine deacetylase [Clostridiales bacterium]|nr:peptidoglycan-N-acetylglucosamine deacetylase [Clostridiales bacterium]
MTLSINTLLIIAIGLFYIAFFLTTRTTMNKFTSLDEIYSRNNRRLSFVLSLLDNKFEGSVESLRELKNIKQNLIIDDRKTLESTKPLKKVAKREIKKLRNASRIRRKEASILLGLIGTQTSRQALENALIQEKDYATKIYISNALTDIHDPASIPVMIKALMGTHKWYREKAISNILDFGYAFQPYFDSNSEVLDIELIELQIAYAGENFNQSTKAYLFDFVNRYEARYQLSYDYYLEKEKSAYKASYLKEDFKKLLSQTCRVLSNYYYMDFIDQKYYQSANPIIQTNAFWALSKHNATDNFKILLHYAGDQKNQKAITATLTKMIEANPLFLYLLEDTFEQTVDETAKHTLSQVLSNRIEYYILKLNTKNDSRAERIIARVIQSGRVNELIGFININSNEDIEHRLASLVSDYIAADSDVGIEIRTYSAKRFLSRCHMSFTPIEPPVQVKKGKREPKLILSVAIMTLLSLIIFPAIFIVMNRTAFGSVLNTRLLTAYVINFNYVLAYYSIAINLVYITLMLLSYSNVRRQARLWNLKNISMLFRNKMLPSISIIAPAFNEEKTIIDSTKSMLNLQYPDYELLIVNDGSQDLTLRKLIEAFKLVRVDYQYNESLKTAPIRGIYRNPSFPRLVVIDKSNGGKADALNAGINVANKTYFCGIDADSLLEPEALLRLASLTLDESIETPALGGNVLPINGCLVADGHIRQIRIPKNRLARFQTIEYIRAFMTGRMGWQRINSLLIISGAFGLFRKDRIINIGGYLTEKERFKKDTVGEDMELVVRISRLMHEIKHPHKILYAFNANCWTEVPEDVKSLKSQRYRWHRGLLDILFFHRKMLFNVKYGRIGLLVMPYFLVFEAIGPMIEFQGYIMVVLAFILGILDTRIALLLFASTILLGIIVSLTSLLIAERETHYFTFKDLMRLLSLAIIENFGPRQRFSFWRIEGQLRVIFGKSNWGKIKRRGMLNE